MARLPRADDKRMTASPLDARSDRGPLDQLPADMRMLTHTHAAFERLCSGREQ